MASRVEGLENRTLLSGAPVITEFLANNSAGIVDGNGVHSDWIEIQNQGDASIDLNGWHLTDDASKPTKYTFPSKVLGAGAYLVVFADSSAGAGSLDSLGYLHTNFSLSTDGEQLSLRQPDGTVASQFAADGSNYPAQSADVSYGKTSAVATVTLVGPNAAAKAFVPVDGSLDALPWQLASFSDATWRSGTTGVGFYGNTASPTGSLLARWTGQSLTGVANGATVASWTAVTGTGTAAQGTASQQPTLVKPGINGLPVVRFDGINDVLKITNQSLNNDANFTVAFVFRTSNAGTGTAGQWYNNSGIVDAEVSGTQNDWGTGLDASGEIAGGVGNPDATIYGGTGLNNGLPHTVVFTKSGTVSALSVDGGDPVTGTVGSSARSGTALAFGALLGNLNYFKGDLAEVRLYSAALSSADARTLAGEMGGTWGVTLANNSFASPIGLSLAADMYGKASTADIRIPFTAPSPSSLATLTLGITYDDGFIAYLNGTPVVSRNVPAGLAGYNATALGARADADVLTPEKIDLTPYINLLQAGGGNILAIKALNASSTDNDLLIVPTLTATPFAGSPGFDGFMLTPTPGGPNVTGYVGQAAPVTFSVPHGYFSNAFTTTLASSTVGATLAYTLDGSDPSPANGVQVAGGAGAPSVALNVSSTTVVRAAAFGTNFLPANVTAASYIRIADILAQGNTAPAGAYWTTAVSQAVVNSTQTYSVSQALTAIPSISLSLPYESMFGAASGIYTHPLEEGDEWERAASVEYFNPSSSSDTFTVDAGVRIQGGVSRDPSRPKKSFKLYFRSSYGDGKLDYPLFGAGDPVQSFDHITLRAGHNYSWANLGGAPSARSDYLRDEFSRDTQEAMTGATARGKFVQLYINGQYWGLYNITETVDATWASQHFGGSSDDYDVIEPDNDGGLEVDDGTIDRWNSLFAFDAAASADNVVSNAEFDGYAQRVDLKNLVDYMLSDFYRGDHDSPVLIGSTTSPRNFYGYINRADPAGKFRFQAWDGELSLDDLTYDRTEVAGDTNPATLFQHLRTNPEFRQVVVDEINRLFNNNGPLSVAAAQARWDNLTNEINVAIVGESARWGYVHVSPPETRDGDWLKETGWIRNTFLAHRTAVVLQELKQDFPEIKVLAATVTINGTAVPGGTSSTTVASGSTVALGNPNAAPAGTVYYTTNGTDPRAYGGGISTAAVAYSAPLTVRAGTHVEARVYRAGVWSALTDITIAVTPPALRVSEMMYHPNKPMGSPYGADEFEFLELDNVGPTPIDLGSMTFTAGIVGTIAAGTTLAAGSRGVVVRNMQAFQYEYGTSVRILGIYTDKLSDSSEEVTLYDPVSGSNIFDYTYQDFWYPTTDGSGYSLVVNDPTQPQVGANNALDIASGWHAGTVIGGTPGAPEPGGAGEPSGAPGVSPVVRQGPPGAGVGSVAGLIGLGRAFPTLVLPRVVGPVVGLFSGTKVGDPLGGIDVAARAAPAVAALAD